MPGSRDRYFNAPPDIKNVGMIYAWAPDAVATGGGSNPVTGTYVPVQANAAGYLQTTASLDFTGNLNASINSVAVTGGQINVINASIETGVRAVNITNGVVPISGNVTANVSTVDTGVRAVNVTNTVTTNATVMNGVLPISGVVSAPNGLISVDTGNRSVSIVGTPSVTVSNGVIPISGFVNTIVTGAVSASFDSAPIVLAQASGNAIGLAVSGLLAGNLTDVALVRDVTGQLYLAAISGFLSSNLTDPAWVTGQVSLAGGSMNVATTGSITIAGGGALNVAVTGGVISSTSSNPVGVTGTKTDNNVSIWGVSAVPYNLVSVGGRAVAATGAGSITGGYNTGDYVMFSFNKDNGALMVNQGTLDSRQDTVTVVNSGSSFINNPAPSGNYPYTSTQFFFGRALPENQSRLEMFVQNTHTGIPLYVRLHTGAASTGAFSMILNPSTVQGWAGSSFGSSTYKGAVQVSGGSWIAWEI